MSVASLIAGAALSAVTLAAATAADVGEDFLRGSLLPSFDAPSYQDWSGVNFGVYISRSNQSADFGSGTSDLISYILRNTTIENEPHVSEWTTAGRSGSNATGYGAFLGYSYEIEPRLIVGLDATYQKFSSGPSASYSDTMGRSYQTTDGYLYNVDLDSRAQIAVKDYATMRARLGYSFGQFLPYAILGAAAARVDVSRSATVGLSATDVNGVLPVIPYHAQTQTDSRSTITYGLVAGLGLDAMILPNVFLRAEYEYVQFAPVNGIKMNLQTGRVGLGVKF